MSEPTASPEPAQHTTTIEISGNGQVNAGFEDTEGPPPANGPQTPPPPRETNHMNGDTPHMNGDAKTNGVEVKTPGSEETKELTEAVNLELVNMQPYSNSIPIKKESTELDIGDPYDEYFVPVNQHKKYMRGEKLYVTQDKRRSLGGSKKKCCWGLLTAIVLGAIVAILLGVILSSQDNMSSEESRTFNGRKASIGGGLAPTQTTTTTQKPISTTEPGEAFVDHALQGELTIDNLEFTPGLADKNSPEFKNLAASLEDELKKALFDHQTLHYGAADISVKVLEFRSGSIVVIYRIGWKFKEGIQNPPDPITKEGLKMKLQEHIRSSDGFLYNYRLPLHNLKSERVTDECAVNNGGCSQKCEFDQSSLQFLCSCDEPYELGKDGKTCIKPETSNESSDEHSDSLEHSSEEDHLLENDLSSETHEQHTSDDEHEASHHPEPTAEPEPSAEPLPEPKPSEPSPEPEPSAEPEPSPEPEPSAEPEPSPVTEEASPVLSVSSEEASPEPEPASAEPASEPAPASAEPSPEPAPSSAVPSPEPTSTEASLESAHASAEPNPEPAPAFDGTLPEHVIAPTEPTPEPVPSAEPSPEPVPSAEPSPEPVPSAEPSPEPVSVSGEPSPEPVPVPSESTTEPKFSSADLFPESVSTSKEEVPETLTPSSEPIIKEKKLSSELSHEGEEFVSTIEPSSPLMTNSAQSQLLENTPLTETAPANHMEHVTSPEPESSTEIPKLKDIEHLFPQEHKNETSESKGSLIETMRDPKDISKDYVETMNNDNDNSKFSKYIASNQVSNIIPESATTYMPETSSMNSDELPLSAGNNTSMSKEIDMNSETETTEINDGATARIGLLNKTSDSQHATHESEEIVTTTESMQPTVTKLILDNDSSEHITHGGYIIDSTDSILMPLSFSGHQNQTENKTNEAAEVNTEGHTIGYTHFPTTNSDSQFDPETIMKKNMSSIPMINQSELTEHNLLLNKTMNSQSEFTEVSEHSQTTVMHPFENEKTTYDMPVTPHFSELNGSEITRNNDSSHASEIPPEHNYFDIYEKVEKSVSDIPEVIESNKTENSPIPVIESLEMTTLSSLPDSSVSHDFESLSSSRGSSHEYYLPEYSTEPYDQNSTFNSSDIVIMEVVNDTAKTNPLNFVTPLPAAPFIHEVNKVENVTEVEEQMLTTPFLENAKNTSISSESSAILSSDSINGMNNTESDDEKNETKIPIMSTMPETVTKPVEQTDNNTYDQNEGNQPSHSFNISSDNMEPSLVHHGDEMPMIALKHIPELSGPYSVDSTIQPEMIDFDDSEKNNEAEGDFDEDSAVEGGNSKQWYDSKNSLDDDYHENSKKHYKTTKGKHFKSFKIEEANIPSDSDAVEQNYSHLTERIPGVTPYENSSAQLSVSNYSQSPSPTSETTATTIVEQTAIEEEKKLINDSTVSPFTSVSEMSIESGSIAPLLASNSSKNPEFKSDAENGFTTPMTLTTGPIQSSENLNISSVEMEQVEKLMVSKTNNETHDSQMTSEATSNITNSDGMLPMNYTSQNEMDITTIVPDIMNVNSSMESIHEISNKTTCETGEFACGDGLTCLAQAQRCDNKMDCTDGSDEINCDVKDCGDDFKCKDGKCLNKSMVCDSIKQCSDGSDEENCGLESTGTPTTEGSEESTLTTADAS